MDDQALESQRSNFNYAVSVAENNCTSSPAIVKNDGSILFDESMGKSKIAGDLQETPEQTLPIMNKIEELTIKLQKLKEEHAALCTEFKGLKVDHFLGSEVSRALQSLGTEHEVLKNKYQEEIENLKNRYLEERDERKRLYNEVIELKGNIRVYCRCRPLNMSEISDGCRSVVDFDFSEENELQIVCSDSSRKQFKFEHVFRPEDDQDAVFAQTAPIVISVLDGYNVCIFAYGQTGSGKTFTMEGIPENRGVNYRTLEELFRESQERSRFMRYNLFVSMLEIYNEKIQDLFVENAIQPAKKLEIRQSAEGTQEVPGLVEAQVHSINEVWELFKSGSRARSVGSTNANENSSRSHCLVRVSVVGDNLINGQKTRSNLWLVDLAGSERLGKIEAEGERLKESQFINKSLSALGDVISALASKTAHIPYRNSKLTHILQSSLGGDCKTLMFLQISPNPADLGETLCSLNFASRVRGVEHGPARKQSDITELFKYKQLAEKAKQDEKEQKKLQDSVQSLQLRLSVREHLCKNLQDKVKDLENQLAEERKARSKQENRTLSFSSQPSISSSLSQSQMATTDKKPPLAPSRLRQPLRGITNIMPNSSPIHPAYKARKSMIPKRENDTLRMPMAEGKAKAFLKPRHGSLSVRSPPTTTKQVFQPRRRASIATNHADMSTPLNRSSARVRSDREMGRQSFVWDPRRVWRTSSVHSPMRQTPRATLEKTPVVSRKSSKFMGSPPPLRAGSWKLKHPTVVALQKKQLVWSPLKMKAMKFSRRSLAS